MTAPAPDGVYIGPWCKPFPGVGLQTRIDKLERQQEDRTEDVAWLMNELTDLLARKRTEIENLRRQL